MYNLIEQDYPIYSIDLDTQIDDSFDDIYEEIIKQD